MNHYLLNLKQKLWVNDLKPVDKLMKDLHLDVWVDSGNLLALYRSRVLSPNLGDGDIDYSMVWNKDAYQKMQAFKERLRFMGYQVEVHYFGFKIKKWRKSILLNNIVVKKLLSKMGLSFLIRTPINISFFRCVDDFYWCTWLNKPSGDYLPRVVPSQFYNRSKTFIDFMGVRFPVLENPEEYLAYKYGADWKTPNANWIYCRDDGTIKKQFANANFYQGWLS
jgi:hypothetical protein